MRVLAASLVLLGVILVQPAVAADTNKEKIVGKWKPTKGENIQDGMVIELTQTGKINLTLDIGGKSMTIEMGAYRVDGDKLTVTIKQGDKEDSEVNIIKSLTDTKLVIVDKEKKEMELERLKAK
jgi:uncharacterized protein (TIGR03066 family)